MESVIGEDATTASRFEGSMFAPCGMNCTVCYRHLGERPCAGCRGDDRGKPNHCRNCTILECVQQKGVSHCWQCDSFSCNLIRTLDRSYRKRYGVSLIANSLSVKEYGMEAFMASQRSVYTCSDCGGIISLQDGDCSGCGRKYPLGRRSVNELE